MPTYDYNCPKCGYITEEFHSMSEDPDYICPECKETLKKGPGGGTGYIWSGEGTMSGGTRNNSFGFRHGKKKTGNTLSATEAATLMADVKADQSVQAKEDQKHALSFDADDPYANI